MFNTYETVINIVKVLEDTLLDAQKFDEGNHQAGRRTRKALSEVMKESKSLRAEILALQKKRKE